MRSFVEQLTERTSAPGGGSTSAYITSMVSTLLLCMMRFVHGSCLFVVCIAYVVCMCLAIGPEEVVNVEVSLFEQ